MIYLSAVLFLAWLALLGCMARDQWRHRNDSNHTPRWQQLDLL